MGFEITKVRDGSTVLIKLEFIYKKTTICSDSIEADSTAALIQHAKSMILKEMEGPIRGL